LFLLLLKSMALLLLLRAELLLFLLMLIVQLRVTAGLDSWSGRNGSFVRMYGIRSSRFVRLWFDIRLWG
jgi:hypothetical protein